MMMCSLAGHHDDELVVGGAAAFAFAGHIDDGARRRPTARQGAGEPAPGRQVALLARKTLVGQSRCDRKWPGGRHDRQERTHNMPSAIKILISSSSAGGNPSAASSDRFTHRIS